MAIAMRVVAAARAALAAPSTGRRSVFDTPRRPRRAPLRQAAPARAALPLRGGEDLH